MRSNAKALLTVAVLSVTFAATLSPDARAASARDGGGGGDDARLRMMLQRVGQENAALKAKQANLETELKSLKEELETVSEAGDASKKTLATTKRDLAIEKRRGVALSEQNTDLRGRLEELAERFRALAEQLRSSETNNQELTSLSRDYDERVLVCERNNENLFKITDELLQRYRNKGFFRSLREREPFAQLKRAEVENMMDEYRYLAEEMRLKYDDPGNDSDEASEEQVPGR